MTDVKRNHKAIFYVNAKQGAFLYVHIQFYDVRLVPEKFEYKLYVVTCNRSHERGKRETNKNENIYINRKWTKDFKKK